ncbi:DUF4333 domain-containing protein [Actinophytocola glycyrrhizae]|uniref:DUF4333 domain-containing protein n=1 Tax=Actinophytocola glycyrrhizae TaxID=2044873 RepID=A0ABV9S285_9PSEU
MLAGVVCAVPALTGCSVSVETEPEAVITEEVLEKGIADALEKSVGQRPDSVECPGSIKAAAGESVRCELSAGADRYGLTATVSSYDKDNGNADYDIEVDDEPAG